MTTGRCWSFTYDAPSNTLTKVLDNAPLSFAGPDSDFDVDELGNAYYTGYAGNGTNQAGVSIYKKSAVAETVVGGDNVLKYGTVVKLKLLNGKVFFVVTGRRTGTDITQLSILKQD